MSAPFTAFDQPPFGVYSTVFKSGPLFISSKGLGWKSWKKRWFVLTRTSLVFYKSDPSSLPERSEVNVTLGGIDLNNSGSVVVREDKKLLTVLFPDGRAFTLKAETSEDLYEWKTALEHALAQAPSAALVIGQNGIFRNDASDTIEGSFNNWREKRPVKSMAIGRPILLALEDIDGGPSFLEKALRFLEKNGTKVEGILRQSADVEEVENRVQEYDQGKNEFGPDEDAHVIGDCVKLVLRELPSSPVPASCCTALLEACKIVGKEARVDALKSAILETFPEPNRRLLQRILKMMHTISLNASENRMNSSAVAACMAPLLLRPLLAGECELDDDFDVDADNSAQLIAAANAANNGQAIITSLLEEYENIFGDENLHRCSISANSRVESSGSEDSTDDENIDIKDNGYHDAENEVDPNTDDERVLSGKSSESSGYAGSDLYEHKVYEGEDYVGESPGNNLASTAKSNLSIASMSLRESKIQLNGPQSMNNLASSTLNVKRSTFGMKSTAWKTPSMESVDSSGGEESAIQRLEIAKNELRERIAKEARGNAILQASLERRKQALHERRLALEQDVSRLHEQLQAERDLRAALEVGLSMSSELFSTSRGMDSQTRAELEEIALAEADVARLKQKVAELHHQLNQQRQHHLGSLSDTYDHYQQVQNHNPRQKYFQPGFDTTLAFVNHERKQRTEESLLGRELKNTKGQTMTNGYSNSSRQSVRKQLMDDICTVNSRPEVLDYSRNSSTTSSTLVELTTRLDFFKERRSQLMEQLHNLDSNHGAQDLTYKQPPSSSPPWN